MRIRLKSVARVTGCVLIAALVLVGHVPPILAGAVEVEAGIDAIKRKDYEAAYKILRPEAEAGNARAQFAIGQMYVQGYFVAKSDETGIKWYRRAAAQGFQPAFYLIGNHYLFGFGIQQDFDKAYAAYVAADDHPGALLALGEIHRSWGPKDMAMRFNIPDAEKAFGYYLRAARAGVRAAFYRVAAAYCGGYGVNQDISEAFMRRALGLLSRGKDEGDPDRYVLNPGYWEIFECPPHATATPEQRAAAIATARAMLKALPKVSGVLE